MKSSSSLTTPDRLCLLERFRALREHYQLLRDRYEGWRDSDLPPLVRAQLLSQTRQDIRDFQTQLAQFRTDLAPFSNQ